MARRPAQQKTNVSTRSFASAYSLRCYDLAEALSIIKVEAILFDLDGVLANSIAVLEESWGIWSAEKGLDFEAVMKAAHGRRKPEILAMVVPDLDPQPEIERLMQLETDRIASVKPVRGAAELVARLPPGKWAIGTSGERPGALARLQQVGITPPAVIISAEDVEEGKPHPDVYLKAAAGIGVDPQRCVVFEDAPAGIAAARAAGAVAVALLTTYPAEAFPPGVPLIRDFTQVSLAIDNGELSLTLLS
jgi:mannitol-1-/sugar-/sorbitol-6-phosphatase